MDVTCKETDRQTLEKNAPKVQSIIEPVILCKNCNAVVTKPEFAVRTGQGFSQAFANPAGHIFEIGCFSQAPGCSPGSGRSNEFTWYPGYDWRIGICRNCMFHLGWIFLPVEHGSGSKFYGLILDHLVFP
ncbi:MAG: cereblon family protein [Desulfobacterales bacterium]|nr:cereblon family protein [Desulfobacterales bacterium]